MKKQKGFSLIELLVVITIIGILAAVGLASYRVANQKARDSRRQADIQAIQSSLEVYRTKEGEYPPSLEDINNSTYFSSGIRPYDPTNSAPHVYGYTRPTRLTYTLTYDLETDEMGVKTVYNP